MKTFFRFSILMVALAVVFTGCSKDDEPDLSKLGDLTYGVKTGKITYKYTYWYDDGTETNMETVIFDDNGKRMRVEMSENFVMIYDGIAKKTYMLYTDEKTYYESSYGEYSTAMFIYLGDDVNSAWKQYYPGFKKLSDKTIAGKKCSVVSWTDEDGETIEWGGWNRITFWQHSYTGSPGTDGSVKIEATSFTESIPAGSFTIPSDYTKESY